MVKIDNAISRDHRAEGTSKTGKVNTKKGEDEESLEHDVTGGRLAMVMMLILGTTYVVYCVRRESSTDRRTL